MLLSTALPSKFLKVGVFDCTVYRLNFKLPFFKGVVHYFNIPILKEQAAYGYHLF